MTVEDRRFLDANPLKRLHRHTAHLSDWGLGVALARNAEAIEDGPRRVGAIEGVEMNSGNVVIQEIVALFQGEVDSDAADHFTIVFAALQGAQKFGRETCPTRSELVGFDFSTDIRRRVELLRDLPAIYS